MSKVKGFASKKPRQEAEAPLNGSHAAPAPRFDIADFEKEAIAEARAAGSIRTVSKNQIDPDPDQPRKEFSDEAMQELIRSINDHGILQPIIVREVGKRYMIIAGERRWRASLTIDSLNALDVVIRNDVEPLQILLMQIAENNHRDNMTPMDTARAYHRVKELVGSQRGAADRLGVSESQVSITLGLLKSPEAIQALASNTKVRDITTLNLVQRLHEQNPKQAESIVSDILQGRIEAGGVRKEVKERLQAAKGTGGAKKTNDITRLEADEFEILDLNNRAMLRIITKRSCYEIVMPGSLDALLASVQKAQEEER